MLMLLAKNSYCCDNSDELILLTKKAEKFSSLDRLEDVLSVEMLIIDNNTECKLTTKELGNLLKSIIAGDITEPDLLYINIETFKDDTSISDRAKKIDLDSVVIDLSAKPTEKFHIEIKYFQDQEERDTLEMAEKVLSLRRELDKAKKESNKYQQRLIENNINLLFKEYCNKYNCIKFRGDIFKDHSITWGLLRDSLITGSVQGVFKALEKIKFKPK